MSESATDNPIVKLEKEIDELTKEIKDKNVLIDKRQNDILESHNNILERQKRIDKDADLIKEKEDELKARQAKLDATMENGSPNSSQRKLEALEKDKQRLDMKEAELKKDKQRLDTKEANLEKMKEKLESAKKQNFLNEDALKWKKTAIITKSSLQEASDGNLEDYIAAARLCEGEDDVNYLLQELLAVNKNEFENLPYPFICIIASSGTGKTQLVATTALANETETVQVFYFYVGIARAEEIQRFYKPHLPLWSVLRGLLKDFRTKFEDDGDIPGAGEILFFFQNKGHPVLDLLWVIFFGNENEAKKNVTIQDLRQAFSLQKEKKPIVFLDEVPPKESSLFIPAIMLRDLLRAISIRPVSMSTHSGAHNALPKGSDSRSEGDHPQLWCTVITKLPAYHGSREGYMMSTERPLVQTYLKKLDETQKNNLMECVKAVKSKLVAAKPKAWRKSPIFQLCQLFRSKEDERVGMAGSHQLVGEHFGHLDTSEWKGSKDESTYSNNINRQEIEQFQTVSRVRMPSAETEPILFLALTTWTKDALDSSNGDYFPLVDHSGKAISVRAVFDANTTLFNPPINLENPNAMKLNGNILEVLALASITLASLQVYKEGEIGNVPLHDFVASVFVFMTPNVLSRDALELKSYQIHELLDDHGMGSTARSTIPAVASADSGFSQQLSFPSGYLKRPADAEQCDGSISDQNKKLLIHIECKNHKDGLTTELMEGIIERFRADCPLFFIFTSNLNGMWQNDSSCEAFFIEKLGLELGYLAIMVLSNGSDPYWLETLSKQSLKPGKNCKGLVFVFSIGAIS